MGRQEIVLGAEIPTVTKKVNQEKMTLYENVYDRTKLGLPTENQHTSIAAAKARVGTSFTIASGRMELTYCTEALRNFFGPEAFGHTAKVRMMHIRPVRDGDTITAHGKVTEVKPEAAGKRVTVDIWCDNQNGDKTGVGSATVLVK